MENPIQIKGAGLKPEQDDGNQAFAPQDCIVFIKGQQIFCPTKFWVWSIHEIISLVHLNIPRYLMSLSDTKRTLSPNALMYYIPDWGRLMHWYWSAPASCVSYPPIYLHLMLSTKCRLKLCSFERKMDAAYFIFCWLYILLLCCCWFYILLALPTFQYIGHTHVSSAKAPFEKFDTKKAGNETGRQHFILKHS